MKPYGIPRTLNTEFPDIADINKFGFKSSISRCKKKSGDYPNSFKSTQSKAKSRRYWKRVERQKAKCNIDVEF